MARAVKWSDLPEPLIRLAGLPSDEAGFRRWITRLEQDTRERVAAGEWEHLIYYVLQSALFTSLPRVEPAVSSKDFVQRIEGLERSSFLRDGGPFEPEWETIPPSARARLREFLGSRHHIRGDRRFTYFQQMLAPYEEDAIRTLPKYLQALARPLSRKFN